MKRVIAWVLIFTLCLGLFAGCKQNNNTNETPSNSVADLEAALEYVKTVYKKAGEKTPKDFQRISNVPVNGKNYEVVWTANVGEDYVKVVKGTDGMVTIDVKEDVKEDVKYVLTATISDGGNSVSHSWNHLLPAPADMLSIVNDAYALASGESMDYEVTLTGKITLINTPWSDDYKNITVTIAVEGAEDKPIQCYRLSGEGAKDLKVGDTITVTGKLKNYNGTVEFDAGCVLGTVVAGEAATAPTDPAQILKEAYALKENQALAYEATLTGVITKVDTEYNPGYKNVTVTMVVGNMNDYPITCYRLVGDGADKIGKGDTITVKGFISNYKGTIEFVQGCTLESWKDTGKNDPKPEDTFTTTLVPEVVTNPVAGTAYKFFMYQAKLEKNLYLTGEMDGYYMATTYDPAKAVDVFLEEVSGGYRVYFMKDGVKTYLEMNVSGTHKNAIFTTSPVKTLKWNTAIKSVVCDLDVDGGSKDFYFGTYDFYKTFGASDLSYITGEEAGNMDTKNFVGRFAVLKETAVEEKSAAEQAFETLKEEYRVEADLTVTEENYTRKNVYTVNGTKVTVTWTTNTDAVQVTDNGDGTATFTVTRGDADVLYTLKATIVDGKNTYEKTWECKVPAMPKTSAKDILDAAYALEDGQSLADEYTLSGVITKITTPYDSNYKNVSVEIIVEGITDKPILCYRLKGEGADAIKVGDNITVTGILKNYKGTIEFDSGCTLDAFKTPAQIVEDVYALESGTSLENNYVLTGIITNIDTPYNEQYGNITVTIAVPGCDDKPIQCYRLAGEGADLLQVGCQITVYGTLKNYNGTYEFDKGCVLMSYVNPEEPAPEIPVISIPNANEIGVAQTSGETEQVYQIQGVITEIVNTTYGNLYIQDAAGNKLYIYGLNDAEGKRYDAMTIKPVVGDILVIQGRMSQFSGKPQMKNATVVSHTQVLTIEAANTLGVGLSSDTETKYLVSGTVKEIKNTTYGNLYIQDETGAVFYIYGTYSADGANRYDAMEQKPQVGDYISVYGVIGQFGGNAQMKSGWVVTHRVGATLPEANTIGQAVANNETTDIKYQVSGTVTEIKNATYGNLYIQDQEGNTLYIYGLYDAIGNLRYDAMTVKPAVGDTVTIYGVLSQYKGTAQIKDGWLLAHTVPTVTPDPDPTPDPEPDPDPTPDPEPDPEPTTPTYTKITGMDQLVTGQYVMVVGNGYAPTTITSGSSPWLLSAQPVIDGDKVTDAKAAVWTITVDGTSVKLTDANGTTIKPKAGNNNGIQSGDYDWAVTFENGTFRFAGVGSDTTILACNNSPDYEYKFRSYKTSTINGDAAGYLCDFALYKLDEEQIGGGEGGEEEQEPTTAYTKITGMDQLVTGQYVMVVGNGYAPTTITSGSSPWLLSVQPVIDGDVVTDTKNAVWTITVNGTSVKLTDANGATIKPKAGNNNGIQSGDYEWAVTFENGTFRFAGVGSDTTILACNNSPDYEYKFRSYKTSTINGNAAGYPCDFTLYKLGGTASGGQGSGSEGGESQDPGTTTPPITDVVYTYGSTDAYSNVIKNWGRRGVVATFLSPNAVKFYADNNVTYEDLVVLVGASNLSTVPSSALYTALHELMESNHTVLTSYGDTRYLYCFTDCQDQNETAGISAFYSGQTVGPNWDSGSTWNREHCWPKSKTVTPDVNNNTTGECGDLMTLRPVKSNINSTRGNKAYGLGTGCFDPNTISNSAYNLHGDVARIVLYAYVRWENTSNMWGGEGVIESVDILLDWIEEDPVDTWEMGRNDSVESVTGTRNVFVDYPELAFVLFGEEIPTMVTPSGKAAA